MRTMSYWVINVQVRRSGVLTCSQMFEMVWNSMWCIWKIMPVFKSTHFPACSLASIRINHFRFNFLISFSMSRLFQWVVFIVYTYTKHVYVLSVSASLLSQKNHIAILILIICGQYSDLKIRIDTIKTDCSLYIVSLSIISWKWMCMRQEITINWIENLK